MSKSKFTKSQIKELIEVYQAEVKKLAYQTKEARTTIAKLRKDMKKAPSATKAKPAKKKPAKKKKVVKKKTTAKRKPAKKKTTAKKKPATKKVVKKVVKKKTTAKKKPATRKVAKRVVKKVTKKKATRKVAKKVTKKPATRKVAKKVTSGKKGKAGRKAVTTPWDKFVMSTIKEAKKGMVSADLFVKVKAKAQAAKEYKNDAVTKTLINRSLQKLVNKQKSLAKFKFAGRGYAYGLPTWGSRGRLKPAYKV